MNTLKNQIDRLSNISSEICITISYPTHRSFPDNKQDDILLKKLINEAKKNTIKRFGKRDSSKVLEYLSTIENEIDNNYNLDSCHIFINENTYEIIKLPISVSNSEVIINSSFDTHYLQKAIENSKEYLILLLSQSGVYLYDTINDTIIKEICNDDFPFTQNNHYITHSDKASDAKQVDNMVREYFNKIDKSIQKVHKETNLQILVICTPRNYQHLLAVADKPSAYIGNSPINYNEVALHNLAKQAWGFINS